MSILIVVLTCFSCCGASGAVPTAEDAAHLEELAKFTNGLWKIESSKSFVRIDGSWRENQPKWRYVLFIDDSIVTFRKLGEPHYWATTTHVVSFTKSGPTISFEAKDSYGVKQKGTMELGKEFETMKLAWEWTDTSVGRQRPVRFKSERRLEKINPDAQRKLLTDLMRGCKFLGNDGSKVRNLVQQHVQSDNAAENTRLNPSGGSGGD